MAGGGGAGDELGKPAQVLGDGCECELVLCTARSAQAKPAEPKNALQVGEQHLDAFCGSRQDARKPRSCERTGDVAASSWMLRGSCAPVL